MTGSGELVINKTLSIAPEELQVRFIHAAGPGGQNVNKVATAAQLRFSVVGSASLPDDVKRRLTEIAGNRMNREGELIITARRFRSQARNRSDAIRRLKALIARAAQRRSIRIPTGIPRRVKRRRLDEKSRRSQVKIKRRKPGVDD